MNTLIKYITESLEDGQMNTSNKIVIIKAEDSKEFLKEFNDNVVDKEFLESCKKTRELFRKK